MKRHIYIFIALLMCVFMACRKEVPDVLEFGKVTISSISPAAGPAGTYVVVRGHNFTHLVEDAKVHINNTEVRIVTMSPDSMLIQIPEDAVTGELEFNFNRTNPIGGYNYNGQVDSAVTGPVYTVDAAVIPLPMVMEVLPARGRPGAEIAINGYNFKEGQCKVFFGETEGTVTATTATSVTVKVPALEPGMVSLVIQQGTHTVQAGSFEVEEIPKGVKEIFWSSPGKIYKAVMDENGNPVVEIIYDNTTAYSNGLTVDQKNGRLYWMDINKVYYGSTDGTIPPTLICSFLENFMLIDIAFDSQNRVYISAADFAFSGKNHVLRINIDGTGAEEIYKLGEIVPGGLKIDEARGKIYWVDQMFIATYEGSMNGEAEQEAKMLFDGSDGIASATSIALDDTHIYIMDAGNNEILVGARDGSGTLRKLPVPKEFMSGVGDLEIDPDNQYLYWIVYDFMTSGTMYRCKTDGTGVQRIIENMAEAYHLEILL